MSNDGSTEAVANACVSGTSPTETQPNRITFGRNSATYFMDYNQMWYQLHTKIHVFCLQEVSMRQTQWRCLCVMFLSVSNTLSQNRTALSRTKSHVRLCAFPSFSLCLHASSQYEFPPPQSPLFLQLIPFQAACTIPHSFPTILSLHTHANKHSYTHTHARTHTPLNAHIYTHGRHIR